MNEPRPSAYAWANAPLMAATAVINTWAAVIIRGKERTSLHAAIVCDCFANILTMAIHVLMQSPWYKLGSPQLCTGFLFYNMFLITWNRLLPVGIAAFRYMMVCHAVFCHNQGGERRVWRLLSGLMLGLCLASGAIAALTKTSSESYLRCISREEMFRRANLEDFYEPLEVSGRQFSGPLWSPHRLFFNTLIYLYFLVPLLYGAVFSFRRKHIVTIQGIKISLSFV